MESRSCPHAYLFREASSDSLLAFRRHSLSTRVAWAASEYARELRRKYLHGKQHEFS